MEIRDFFTNEEINKIISEQSGLTHPIIDLLQESYDSSENRNFTKYSTLHALRRIKYINSQWFEKKRKIILDKDRYNASATLGEFRCYSAIVDTFGEKNVITVAEGKDPTPDFQISNGKDIICIEVNTIQMNKYEADRLAEFNNATSGKNSIREICYCPYGVKAGFTTTQTVIRKIYNAKTDSLQFSKKNANILWIDLQDEYMSSISDRITKFAPIFSGKHIGGAIEGFCSNELWYSLYAPRDLPVFEGESMNEGEGIEKTLSKMEYDGKFANQKYSFIDAVIYSGAKNIIICENPFAHHQLPLWFINKLTEMNGFMIESSLFSFISMKPSEIIEKECEFVKELSKNKFYSW